MLMGHFEWPLVGRDEQREVIDTVLAAEPARSVVVAGPAGVGRTRLLHEALAVARHRGRPVRWVAATSTAAGVPLGALAPLLPALETASGGLAMLQRAADALGEGGSGTRPVVGIDDAHFLDPLSVTLLHQLAASGTVSLVLTVRTRQTGPDPFARLWKDELATRLDLEPLHRHGVGSLLGAVLSGDVAARTGEGLWRLSEGNPLFLRELVEDGLRSGRLHRSGGLWTWRGDMVPSHRLAELVLDQLGDLEATEWQAMEVLAAAQPLPVDDVVQFSSPDAVAALQRRGLVADAAAGGPGEVRTAHPLFARVVRSRVPEAVLRGIRQQLVAQAAATGSTEDLVHRCASLDGPLTASDPAGWTAAAQQAAALPDHGLAERLGKAAVEAGGGSVARLVLAEATRWQGQPARSERLALEAAAGATCDDDRARLAVTRALNLACGWGRVASAAAHVQEVAGTVRSEEGRALLTATGAVLAFLAGDPQEAVRLGTSVLNAGSSAESRPLAAAATASGLAVIGRTAEAQDTVRAGWTALAGLRQGPELSAARVALAHAEVLALSLGGRLHALDRRVAELHRHVLAAPEWAGDDVACLHRGWAALASGRPGTAVRWFTEASSGLEERDPAGVAGLCRSLTVIARAMTGDVDGARALLQDAPGTVPVYQPHVHLAEAWVAAAEGRRADGGVLALRAAEIAATQGQQAVEAMALHAALRLGREADVVGRLRDLARRVDSPLVDVVATHAEATAQQAGDGLDVVSARFEELGALMAAAEAAADAAEVHDRRRDRQAAAVSRMRAAALARDCGLSETPALGIDASPALTSREQQVACLAAVGLSNQAIADELVVSVRTVEAHLAHVYAKLGINARAQLASVLPSNAVEGPLRAVARVVPPRLPASRRPGVLRPI